jgi:hypothetical protein
MTTSQNTKKPLVGMQTCLELVFTDDETRPSFRTFNKWKAQGFLPYHKVGKRVFMDPVQVRAALDKQFQINPTSI